MNEMTSNASVPLFIADHLAINFLNARYGVEAASRECFVDDRAVLDWSPSRPRWRTCWPPDRSTG